MLLAKDVIAINLTISCWQLYNAFITEVVNEPINITNTSLHTATQKHQQTNYLPLSRQKYTRFQNSNH